jgi:hypothetical protein
VVVRIVTDSTADLTNEQQQAAGITVVPLNVHFGDQVFRDHVDLTADEFFRLSHAPPERRRDRLGSPFQQSLGDLQLRADGGQRRR